MRVDMPYDFGIREPGKEIDQGINVELLSASWLDMDRVDLHEITWLFRDGARERAVPSFPRATLPDETLPFKRSLHGRETHDDALLFELFLDDLAAPIMFLAFCHDGIDDRLR